MGRKAKRQKPEATYVVISYLEGERKLHKTEATSYRDAKRRIARELREELGLWDVNLADITSQGMMVARKIPPKLL